MVHLEKPGRDDGFFCTDEVRARDEPEDSTSRMIAFPPRHYKRPPNVAGGFRMLDLSHEAPIRANLCGSDISKVGVARVFSQVGWTIASLQGLRIQRTWKRWIGHRWRLTPLCDYRTPSA